MEQLAGKTLALRAQAFAKQANAQTWLSALPAVVAELALKWNLEVGDAYPNCGVAYVAPATQQGLPVVLKVRWPHEECRYEADALKIWDGNGAVQLLATEAKHHALLLERCEPGEYLAGAQVEDPIGAMIELLPRLCQVATAPFKTLRNEAIDWQSTLYSRWQASGASCNKALIDSAYTLSGELAHSQGAQVLVHQDLHGHNVLASTRTSNQTSTQTQWLAIDPKPLVGEREFALSPIIRSLEFGATQADVLYRLDRLTDALSLDRERACGWAIVQSIAWSFGSHYSAQQVQTARWLLATR